MYLIEVPVEPDSGLAVRVLDANGTTVGVGVLVGSREILTCAHVINSALGRDRRAQDQPAAEDIVEFAVGDGPPLRGRVRCWLPPPRPGRGPSLTAGFHIRQRAADPAGVQRQPGV